MITGEYIFGYGEGLALAQKVLDKFAERLTDVLGEESTIKDLLQYSYAELIQGAQDLQDKVHAENKTTSSTL